MTKTAVAKSFSFINSILKRPAVLGRASSKLAPEKLGDLLHRLMTTSTSYRKLEEEFGVPRSTIHRIAEAAFSASTRSKALMLEELRD